MSDASDDATLVEAARSGDGEALAELYRRHAGAVATAARDWVDDPQQREDVVQETFARAATQLDKLRDPARFRPWLLQIGRNAAIDELRRRRRFVPDGDELLAEMGDDADDPALAAEVAELAGRIESGLVALSPRDATAVAMAAHLGLGPADIASALDVTPNNAKVILHRARKRLRTAAGLDG